ncbi:MAG: glutamate--tRNA ligase [Clostridia bacterium]
MKIRTRFAPSPTGFLHVGGLRTALYAYLYAKKNNGDFILRIEDTDQARYVEGAVELIYSTLRDAGLIYSEGPDIGGQYGPYIQSLRKLDYLKYAKILVEQGDAYYCFCSKERLEELKEQGATKYDKHCLSLSAVEVEQKLASGVPYVIRQNIKKGVSTYTDLVFGEITIDNDELEDNILIKADGLPTYNFANVVDDHLMNITCVMRGNEYLSSTPKYNLLYDAFGWERPIYIHLPQIMKDAQHKLSKRFGSVSYADFINQGFINKAILNYVALLGWSPKNNQEKMSLEEMVELFSVEGISRSNAIFDLDKMRWLNSLYIKELPFDEFLRSATTWLDKSCAYNKYNYALLAKLIQGRIETYEDIIEKVAFLDEFTEYDLALFTNIKQKTSIELARQILPQVLEVIINLEETEFVNDALYSSLSALAEQVGIKKGQLFWVTRVALTGRESTPGGATELAELLGKTSSIARIKFSIDLLNK